MSASERHLSIGTLRVMTAASAPSASTQAAPGLTPPLFLLKWESGAITAVLAHHSTLLLGGVGRHRIFDSAGRSFGRAGARQDPRHTDRGDETRAAKKLTAGGRQREHALPALA